MDNQHYLYTPHTLVMESPQIFERSVVLELLELRDATRTRLAVIETALAEALSNLPIIQLEDYSGEVVPGNIPLPEKQASGGPSTTKPQ